MARPRSFDRDDALDRAMRLFWRYGYAGTSLEDLTAELGIAKPSLYAAFGNKRALFELALDRYAAVTRVNVERALAEPRAEDVARRFLHEYVDVPEELPRGCLFVQGATACSAESEDVKAAVLLRRRVAEQLLTERLVRAQEEGDLPADAAPADLARYLATVVQGLAVQATSGATAAQLRRVADLALEAWPKRESAIVGSRGHGS
jgi:AcrR family transcriptional regulator